jgi:toxin ParE1/3/4
LTAYQLAEAAEADLRAIISHTRAEWGIEQARAYARALEQAMQALADHPRRHRGLASVHPDLRIARCRKHLIFALPRPEAPTLILAIFHERMDVIARLSHRLL